MQEGNNVDIILHTSFGSGASSIIDMKNKCTAEAIIHHSTIYRFCQRFNMVEIKQNMIIHSGISWYDQVMQASFTLIEKLSNRLCN